MAKRVGVEDELIDVGSAAALVGRHPETVRRWVWSGRLSAERRGRRLLVARGELLAMAGSDTVPSLRDWVDRVRAARASMATTSSGRSAAELVIDDRRQRSGAGRFRARR
jgi:hypothetical protein